MKFSIISLLCTAVLGQQLMADPAAEVRPTEEPAKKSKCPFGFTSSSTTSEPRKLEEVAKYPSDIFKCPTGNAVQKTDVDNFTSEDYEQIVESVIKGYDQSTSPTQYAACILRFAGHDFMDYRKASGGGSDGCVDFQDPDNAGLQECLIGANIPEVYAQNCQKVSLADFVVIAAEAAMGRTSPDYDASNPFAEDTLLDTFKDNFLVGRETSETCPQSASHMPNAEVGCDSLKDVFVDNVFHGFGREAWKLTTAISGAHTLGSAKISNSGYDGTWSDPQDQGIFNNGYFKSLLLKAWRPQLAVGGNSDRNQWTRADLDAPTDFTSIMLNTDMCLVYDNNKKHAACLKANPGPRGRARCKQFNKAGEPLQAQAGNCCAWTTPGCLRAKGGLIKGKEDPQYCAFSTLGRKKGKDIDACCKNVGDDSYGDCDNAGNPQGPGYKIMAKFVTDEDLWIDYYTKAWKIATANGHRDLHYLDESSSDPNPTIVDCSLNTKRRTCRKDRHCKWDVVKTFTTKKGRTIKRRGCVPDGF